jgi:ubiquinone/menaquinone biosynthesis C-methylase UbiE
MKRIHGVDRDYVPAFGKDFLLPFFDPFVKWLGADRVRGKLLDEARIQPDHRLLDIGCGTGTFAIAIKRRYPDVQVVGLDPDPKALARGHLKAERAGLSLRLDRGYAEALPYPDGSFDRVFSTLTLHHLPISAKKNALREACRVLKSGGSLHVLDMAGAEHHGRGRLPLWLHARLHPKDNSPNLILGFMRDAGFSDPQHYASDGLRAGLIVDYYRAIV